MKKNFFAVFVMILFAFGCASGPTKPDKVDNKKVLNISYDKAWKKAVQIFGSEGYSIQSSQKESGSLATGKKAMHLTSEDADCGTYMGLGYIGDSRTVLNVSYSLFFQDLGNDKVDVTVNVEIDGTFQGGSSSKNLNCFSQGRLESVLLRKLSQ